MKVFLIINKKVVVLMSLVLCMVIASSIFADNDIIVNPAANKDLIASAQTLSSTLKEISGKDYAIVTNAPFTGSGILLALTENYNGKLKLPQKIADNYEAFRIVANSKSLVIIGNSPKAVKDGMYTYLNKLGCRWFFPGKRWTIIPKRKNIFIKMDIADAPDYSNRNIWYQYGFGWGERWNAKKIQTDYMKWREANLQGGRDVSCGHSWGHIVNRNKEEFKKHPEYYAMGKDGKRIVPENPATAKFCCSNTNLIKLVAEDRLRLLREKKKKDPYAYMVSVDPSDGPHMCYCPECAKLGSGKPSDMVVNLANGVAEYLQKNEPGSWVGFYAYSAHQDPPTLPIEKNVYVQMATAFNSTKYTTDELIKIWGEKAGAIGIREYYSVMAWNKNLPGRARGASVDYHKEVIPKWYRMGATSISAESNDNWAAQGLGYYIAANLMWNTQCDVNSLVNDFYEKSFGKAAQPVRELYGLWKDSPPLLSAYLATWLEKLEQAAKLTENKDVIARLNDLKAYLHYVVCYYDFENATPGDDAREKYIQLLEYAFRIKSRNVIHSYALARRIANGKMPGSVMKDLPDNLRGKNKNVIDDWNIFNFKTAPWQQNTNEYTDAEIEAFFNSDLKRFIPFKNRVKTYSCDLVVPPTPLEGADDGNCRLNTYRFDNIFYLIADKDDIEVNFTGGRMSSLTLLDPVTNNELQKEMVRPDESKVIKLKTDKPGLYKIVAGGWFTLKFPDNIKVVYEMSPIHHGQPTAYAGPGYFFVPEGTKSFRMAIGTRLFLKDPKGNTLKYLAAKDDRIVKIDVPEGCDGKRWEIGWLSCGKWFFMDLPPFVSLTPNGYIGPREIFMKNRQYEK